MIGPILFHGEGESRQQKYYTPILNQKRMELVQFKGIVPLGNTAVEHRGNSPVLLFSRKVDDFTRVIS